MPPFPEQSDADIDEVPHDGDVDQAEEDEDPERRLAEECRKVHATGYGFVDFAGKGTPLSRVEVWKM